MISNCVVAIAVIIALFCCLFFYLGRIYELCIDLRDLEEEIKEEFSELEEGAE